MLPVVRTQKMQNPFNKVEFIGNVVLDKKGRECTFLYGCMLFLILKDGNTISKRKSNAW